jgi:multiple sugar transport system ATP-binding protein
VTVPDERAEEIESLLGRELLFGIRPENIHDPEFAPRGVTAAAVEVTVDVTELMGNEVFLHMLAGETKLLARADPRTRLRANDHSQVVMDLERVHIFDPESRKTLRSGFRRVSAAT